MTTFWLKDEKTKTYMLAGVVHHQDSLGNSGSIGAGDVQWMTSGRGILHEEMPKPRTAFVYVFEGEGTFGITDTESGEMVSHPKLVAFGDGDHVKITTTKQPVRFVLVSGKPLHEPIARYGPFVMNTREEIEQALRDLRNGTFVQE